MSLPADPAESASPPPPPTIATPPTGLGKVFVRGMLWGTGGLLIGKAGSAIQVFCLGWLFTKTDFGAVSTALSAAMIGDILTDGGLRRVLITRGADYARLARTTLAVALGFNLLGCTLMLGAASVYRSVHPEAVSQLVVFALALVLSTLGTVQRCKLAIDLRYAQSTFLGTASSLLRSALTILFAWRGFGPLAVALPLIFVNLWEAAYVRYAVGALPKSPVDVRLGRELVKQGRWVILAALGGSLITRGDYFVTTWLFTAEQRGDYYNAFSLAIAVFAPLSAAAAAMVQPVMARLRDDPVRQAKAFVRVIRSTVFISTPLSMASALVAPLLIHLAWHGRWDSIAPAVQVLAASECVRQMLSLSLAMLDARGDYHRSAGMIVIDGLLTVAAAVIGCSTGSVIGLATIIAVQRSVVSIGEAAYVHAVGGQRAREMLIQIVPPLLLAAPLAVASILISRSVGTTAAAERWLLAAAAIPATIFYAIACRTLMPLRFAETWEMVRSRLSRRRPTAVP